MKTKITVQIYIHDKTIVFSRRNLNNSLITSKIYSNASFWSKKRVNRLIHTYKSECGIGIITGLNCTIYTEKRMK